MFTLDLDSNCSHHPDSEYSDKTGKTFKQNLPQEHLSQSNGYTTTVNGHLKSVELLSLQNLENQSSKGNKENSGAGVSILVQGQNGGKPEIKKVE